MLRNKVKIAFSNARLSVHVEAIENVNIIYIILFNRMQKKIV